MKSSLPFFITLIMVCACSQSQSNANAYASSDNKPATMTESKKSDPPGDVLKLVKHEVIDKEGTGMVASTYLVPFDWSVQDRLFWAYGDATLPIRYQAKMQSKDNTMGIQVFPDVRAIYSTGPMGASGYPPPKDIISGMKDLVAQERKGIQYKYVSEKVLQKTQQNTQYGPQYDQAGVVKISYEENGQSFEEEFYAKLEIVDMVTPGVYGNMESIVWIANGLVACKATGGNMEKCRKITETFINSIEITKPFFNRLSQVIQLLSDQVYASIYQAGQISKIISQTNDQMIANIDASYQQSQQAADRSNQNFSDYIRGVDRYDNGGDEVQLPSGYSNAWVNDKGEYLLSSSPGYNPSADFYGNWKELRRN